MITQVIQRVLWRFQARPGRAQNCALARSQLGLFCDWDVSAPAMEAIEQHLKACRACAREYEKIGELRRLFDEAHPHPALMMSTPDQRTADIMGYIRKHEKLPTTASMLPASRENLEKPAPFTRLIQRPALAAVACFLLALSLPVFAYLVTAYWDWSASHVALAPTATAALEETKSFYRTDKGTLPGMVEEESGITSSDLISDPAHQIAGMDAMLEPELAMARVEAMLPHTEEEYEAWARREYPHIMWLYDVLMGQIPTSPADSPSGRTVSFGTDDSGAPVIMLPDDEGNVTMFTFPLPAGWSKSKPLWDGMPANIPDWAERLYADTPQLERPTGWRALIIYSAEVFKFDYPTTIEQPNSEARIGALEAAAAILKENHGATSSPCIYFKDPPENYIPHLALHCNLAERTLLFLIAASDLIDRPAWQDVSDCLRHTLILNSPDSKCLSDGLLSGQIEMALGFRQKCLPENCPRIPKRETEVACQQVVH